VRRSRTNLRPSPWALLVGASAVVVVGVVATLVVWAVISSHERISSLSVRGFLNGVSVDAGDADVTVVRGGDRIGVGVQQTDHYTFGHDATVSRSVDAGVLRIRSRCPTTVLHTCSAKFRLIVPDNVPVTVRTGSGAVSFDRYRGSARITTGSGDIHLGAVCGFSLQARAGTGSITADAACAPQLMALRSRTGSVHASVPPGRYRVEADSDNGSADVRGLEQQQEAPFEVQALSGSGDVLVDRR
jgi:hypothetical protein